MNKVLDRMKWSAMVRERTDGTNSYNEGGNAMRTDIKIAIVRSGRRQFEIAAEAGIPEIRLSKYIHNRVALTAAEQKRLLAILGLDQETEQVHVAG
jgi:hypothetical protein